MLFLLALFSFSLIAATENESVTTYCNKSLTQFPGPSDEKLLSSACGKVTVHDSCKSVNGSPIFSYEKAGQHSSQQKILVFSMIHGDETPAGTIGRYWMERLEIIEPRNTWRIVPLLNPDGAEKKTRTNANRVDINRNFPTKDWESTASSYWEKSTGKNPRRFPGSSAASEPETKCAMQHIMDFMPNFIVSIHTPLKVLDFDGPRVKPPRFEYLPWKSLGHFPGSLGRYMWHERKTPVLTMEMKDEFPKSLSTIVQLQDIIGYLVSLEIGKKTSASDLLSPAHAGSVAADPHY